MAFSFKTDVETFNESAEVRDSGGDFELLPNGWYEVELIDAKVEPYSKREGSPYKDSDGLALTLRVTDNNEVGAKRRFWPRLLLAERWNPTAKNPKGAVNFTLNQFVAALGLIDDDGNVEIPDPDELLDASPVFGIRVRTSKPELNPDGSVKYPARNEVDAYISLEKLAEKVANQTLEAAAEKVTPDSPAGNGLFVA